MSRFTYYLHQGPCFAPHPCEATGEPTFDFGGDSKFGMLDADKGRSQQALKVHHEPDQQQSKYGQVGVKGFKEKGSKHHESNWHGSGFQ